jgi:hypothetical protein
MIAKIMKGVAPGQEAREKERDKTTEMDGGALEAWQHADKTREEEREKRQQLQQHPKPKLQPKLQPARKPKSARTPVRRWQTVLPRAKSQRAPIGPGTAPTAG